MTSIEKRLLQKGVKPTANRILILKEMLRDPAPANLADIERRLPLMDKSSIFRTLTLFLENDVVHAFQDGRGTLCYELCEYEGKCEHNDTHIHFFCEQCKQTYCLQHINLNNIPLPEGFLPFSASFVIKGICEKCR
ncbi:MAG: transcriptional repressor [Bacteroidaceae bacterium]|nr:transcriptional repressor [Bacteroidaceae bacterium]